jgi:Leucine-rich repeat (LRR) protein
MNEQVQATRRFLIAVTLVVWALAAGRQVDAGLFAVAKPGPATTRVLHFPPNQCMGSLYVEDPCLGSEYLELGRDLSLPLGLDPERVALGGDWDFMARARGAVPVPADRNVQLAVSLKPRGRDAARLSPSARRHLRDRLRVDPEDLSGLSALTPDDLHELRVYSLVRRDDADDRIIGPICRLTGLEVLSLSQTGVTGRGMERLTSLRSLRALVLSQEFSVGDAGLVSLKDQSGLEYLDCATGATDAGLKHLGRLPRLRWLRLRMGRIRGPGLAELAGVPTLERLSLWGTTGLTDNHVRYLEGLTRLKSLTLWGTDSPLSDATLASIGKLNSLEELYFIRIMTRFTAAGVAHLKKLSNLRHVSFGFSQIGADGLRHLAALPRLESIHDVALSTDSIEALASLENLKSLRIGMLMPPIGAAVPQEDLSGLARLSSLEELSIGGGRWTEDELVVLESLPNLRRLHISGRDVTDRTMPTIGKLNQLEYLNLGTTRVTKRGVNQLSGLTNLRTLDVGVYSRDASTVDEVPLNLSTLTGLKTLELTGFALRDVDLASMANMRQLEWLRLSGTFTEEGLVYLKDLGSLKNLSVSGITCSTGEGLSRLAGLTGLRDLRLTGRVTAAALARLAPLPSLTSLTVHTDESIRPQTVAHLRHVLPVIDLMRIERPRQTGPPRVKTKGSPGQAQPNRARVNRQRPQPSQRRR